MTGAPSQILESALYIDDLESIGRAGNRHLFFRCGPGVLLLFNPEETVIPYQEGQLAVPPHGAHGAGHLCFRATSDEMDTWATRLATAGVEIESTVAWPGGGRSIYFRDPAGNSLEFAEARIWGI